MSRARRALPALIVLALALAGPALAADKAAPVTKRQARQMPAEALKARVLEQFSNVLVEVDRPGGPRPVAPLTDLGYWTRPWPSDEPNVCQATSVLFKFQRVAGDADRRAELDDADTPVVVADVAAVAHYHVLESGRDDMPGGDWVRGRRAQCDGLTPGKTPFFAAEDAESASRGAWLLTRLRASADLPAPGFALECPEADTGCLARLKDVALWSVDRCQGALVWVQCLALSFYGYDAQVVYAWKNGSIVIDRVKIAQAITLGHERRD